jgi:predicted lipoprotein
MKISRTWAVAVAAAAALGVAAPANAQLLRGTVVHHNRHAHSFVVAVHGGGLRAIHARKLPAIGRAVAVRARALRNGTFVATKVRAGHRRTHVRIRGTVSFADRRHHRFTLSANGVSLLVHVARHHGARAAASDVPAPGTSVEVEADLESGDDTVAQTVTPTGTDLTVKVEGKVLAVDTTARTITLSADDEDQSGAQLTISVPDATIDLTTIAPGSEVELLVALHSDGTYSLLGLAGDGNAKQADDQGDEQGQTVGDQEDGGDQQSGDQQESGDQQDQQSGDGGDQSTTTPATDQQSGDSSGSGGGDH